MKFTQTGVILDGEDSAYILAPFGPMGNDPEKLSDELFKRCREKAIENGLPDIPISKDKYYTLSQRMEIVIAETEDGKEKPNAE